MNRARLLLLLSFLLSSCMTERVQPVHEYPDVPKQSTYLVKKVEYDEHGRPLFTARLSSRPGAAGDRFAIVHAVNDRPVRSYDIAIVEHQKADMARPLEVVYEWTGRGFEGGQAIASGILPSGTYSGKEAAAFLVVKAAPVIIGSVTGFVVGVLSSIPETAIELKRVVVNARETVIGYTEYRYDEKGRIRTMKLFPPVGRAEELVRTEFFYTGERDTPDRTEVTSAVENKVRVIR